MKLDFVRSRDVVGRLLEVLISMHIVMRIDDCVSIERTRKAAQQPGRPIVAEVPNQSVVIEG